MTYKKFLALLFLCASSMAMVACNGGSAECPDTGPGSQFTCTGSGLGGNGNTNTTFGPLPASDATITSVAITRVGGVSGNGGGLIGSPEIIAGTTFTVQAQVRGDGVHEDDLRGPEVQGQSVDVILTVNGISSTVSGTTNNNGVATVTFTAPDRVNGNASILASAGGVTSFSNDIDFVPGPPAPPCPPDPGDIGCSDIVVNPKVLPADGTSTSTVTVILNDRLGNPVEDGTTVTLRKDPRFTVTTDDPESTSVGRVDFTVRAGTTNGTIPLEILEVPGLTVPDFTIGIASNSSTGAPSSITISATPIQVAVQGVGEPEQSQIAIQVLDDSGSPLDEPSVYNDASLDNIQVCMVTRPGAPGLEGEETIAGTNAAGQIENSRGSSDGCIEMRTANGSASVVFNSGRLPGPVEIRVRVLTSATGSFNNSTDVVSAVAPSLSVASGPPNNIIFSAPIVDAIVDAKNGNYHRRGKVDVVDRWGNPVPDGTVVNLGVIDRVIAQGTGGSFSPNDPTLTGSSFVVNLGSGGVGFQNSIKTSQGSDRAVEISDRIFISNADSPNRSRFVNALPTTPTALLAQRNYESQPVTPTTNRIFTVGAAFAASMIGANPDGSLTGNSTTTTINGEARWVLQYPITRILEGCYGDLDTDERFSPPQSAQVWLIASSNSDKATGVTNDFCFSAIVGFTLKAVPDSQLVSRNSTGNSFTVEVRDGGQTVPLPFYPVTCSVSGGDATISNVAVQPNINGDPATEANGIATVTFDTGGLLDPTANSESGTIKCFAGDGTVSIAVTNQR